MVSNILKVMLMVTLTWFPCANATIQILTTRVAFNANESEQTVRVNNLSKNPELVQVWLFQHRQNRWDGEGESSVLYQSSRCAR